MLSEAEELEYLRLKKSKAMAQSSPTFMDKVKPVGEAFKEGAIRGATFGVAGKEAPLAGSVMEPTGEKWGRRAGEAAGFAVPLAASEITGGVALEGAAAMRGAGAIGMGIAGAVGTGLTLEAAKQATEGNTNLKESASKIATTGILFAGLGVIGEGLGSLRKVFGEKMPIGIYRNILQVNKSNNLADLKMSGKMLAEEASKHPGLYGDKEEMLGKIESEIPALEDKIQGVLSEAHKKAMTPTPNKSTPTKVLNLQYTPNKDVEKVFNPETAIQPSGQVIHLPAKFETPYFGSEIQPPYLQSRAEADISGLQTNPVLFKKGGSRGVFQPVSPQEEAAQREYVKEARRESAKAHAEITKPLEKPDYIPKQKPNIDVNEIADSLDPLIKEMSETSGREKEIEQVLDVKKKFLEKHGEGSSVTVQKANSIKRAKYKMVGDRRFLKDMDENPAKYQAERTLAHAIRNKLEEQIPEISPLNKALSVLINTRDALMGAIAGEKGGFVSNITESGYEHLATRGSKIVQKALGKPSKYISPAAGYLSKLIVPKATESYFDFINNK